jgi:hypothetical protein
VDANVKSCAEVEGDACPTPWDLCCEDTQSITANSVTVQVVDDQGHPLKVGLKGHGGLKPLSEVVARGTVKKSADGKAVVLNATEMFVKP